MNLDTLTTKELGRLFPIMIVEASDSWPMIFEVEKDKILGVLGDDIAISIEHVGSTAIGGICAKPTIDILVEITNDKQIEAEVIRMMEDGGYHYLKDHPEHLMFVKGYTPEGFKGQCFHIHVGPRENKKLFEMILFRNYLRVNRQTAIEYEELKNELAIKHKYDRESYTEAKTEFITSILASI